MPKQVSSTVWNEFEREPNGNATCKICGRIIQYVIGGSTTMMWTHLKYKHRDVYAKYRGDPGKDVNDLKAVSAAPKVRVSSGSCLELFTDTKNCYLLNFPKIFRNIVKFFKKFMKNCFKKTKFNPFFVTNSVAEALGVTKRSLSYNFRIQTFPTSPNYSFFPFPFSYNLLLETIQRETHSLNRVAYVRQRRERKPGVLGVRQNHEARQR